MKPKVLIAIPTAEFARRADFYDYLNTIDRPEGTIQTSTHSQSPAKSRNIMIEQALEHDCTHIFFIDDDCVIRPDVLKKLLAHDLDIVSGLYLRRNFPFYPLIFDRELSDGKCQYSFLNKGRTGLVEVVATGLGACLIKMDVFKKLEKPWIRLGELELDHWCDDIGFFRRVREAGFKIHVDLDVPVGHFMTSIIYPDKDNEGNWYTSIDSNGTGIARIHQDVPSTMQIEEALAAAGIK